MSLSDLNIELFRSINDLGKQYDFLNPIAVFFAEYMQYALCLGILVHWFTRSTKHRMMVIQAVCAFVVAEIIGKTAGLFYSHVQPFAALPNVHTLIEHGIDNSFPSDHTILFFSVCFSFLLVRGKEGVLWLALACCVAVSRIWVGVHYPVDIAAGALIGIVAALLARWAVPKAAFIRKLLGAYEKAERRILPSADRTH